MYCQSVQWAEDDELHSFCIGRVVEGSAYCEWHQDFDPETEAKWDRIWERRENNDIDGELIAERNKIVMAGNDVIVIDCPDNNLRKLLVPVIIDVTIGAMKCDWIDRLEMVPERFYNEVVKHKWYAFGDAHAAAKIVSYDWDDLEDFIKSLERKEINGERAVRRFIKYRIRKYF